MKQIDTFFDETFLSRTEVDEYILIILKSRPGFLDRGLNDTDGTASTDHLFSCDLSTLALCTRNSSIMSLAGYSCRYLYGVRSSSRIILFPFSDLVKGPINLPSAGIPYPNGICRAQ